MTYRHLKNSFLIALCLVVTLGLALHESKSEILSIAAIGIPAAFFLEGAHALNLLGGEQHTHVERVSASKSPGYQVSLVPKVPVRDDKIRHMKRSASRGNGLNNGCFQPEI